jgi:hypothetical protein
VKEMQINERIEKPETRLKHIESEELSRNELNGTIGADPLFTGK